MGQSTSQNLVQSKLSVPKISQMQFWKQAADVRYGDIRIFKTTSSHAVAVKDHIFQDEEQWTQFKIQSDKTIGNVSYQFKQIQQNLFLIQMIDLQHVTEKELCTQLTQAHSLYEYFDDYLERVINELQLSKQYFEEIEIMAMLHCTLTALLKLNDLQKSHGDIRPLTISVTSYAKRSAFRKNEPFTIFKLTDIQEMTNMNAYRKCVAKQQGAYNLSPEQLSFLKQKVINPNYDLNKSDVFSIGLTALQMATLNSLQDIYDYTSYTLNMDKLDAHIYDMKKSYSEQLSSIVCELLTMAPDNRPTPKQAHELLYNQRFQLEDYFRSSTIADFLPNYSIDFRSPVNINQKQIILQSHQIQNQEPSDLFQQMTNLEQRAKLALKRSQDAQIRYQKSPVSKMQQILPNWEPTKSLQQYSNLTPFTLQEILPLQNKQMNIPKEQIIIQDPPSNRQSFFMKNFNNQQYQQQPYEIHDHEMLYQNDHNDEEYVYNQQELDEQPKQSVVEQVELTNSNLKQLQSRPLPKNQSEANLQQQLFQSINTDQGKLPYQPSYQQTSYQQSAYQDKQQYQQSAYQEKQYQQSAYQEKSYQQQFDQKQLQNQLNLDQQSQPRSSTYNQYPSNQINESIADHQRSPYALQQRQSLALSQDKVVAQQLTGQQVEQTLQNLQNRQSNRQDSFGAALQRPVQPIVVPKSPEAEPQNLFPLREYEKSQSPYQQTYQQQQLVQDEEAEQNYNPQLTESMDSQQAISVQSKPQSLRGTVVGSQTGLKVPPAAMSRQQRLTIQKQSAGLSKTGSNTSSKKNIKTTKK